MVLSTTRTVQVAAEKQSSSWPAGPSLGEVAGQGTTHGWAE